VFPEGAIHALASHYGVVNARPDHFRTTFNAESIPGAYRAPKQVIVPASCDRQEKKEDYVG